MTQSAQMRTQQVVYIAGPFRARTPWEQILNIRMAEHAALQVWQLGHVALCPHLNTQNFQGVCEDGVWLRGDLEMLRRCDAVVLVYGWERSAGTLAEIEEAQAHGIPVYVSVEAWQAGEALDRDLAPCGT